MTGSDDAGLFDSTRAPDPLIGTPERNSAQEALEAHLIAKRINPAEHERRVEASQLARTQSELSRIFADLPVPHPTLPATTVPPAEPDERPPPPIFFAGCLTLVLGLPVAVVLGFAYGIWWALAVPVGAIVTMTYIEHLRAAHREQALDRAPRSPKNKEQAGREVNMFDEMFPILSTPDLPRSLGFYRDLLGGEVTYQFPPDGEPVYVALRLGQSRLGIGRQAEPGALVNDRITLWVYADDCDAGIDRLRRSGVEVIQEPTDQPWGERMATAVDPDGNRVIVASRPSGETPPAP